MEDDGVTYIAQLTKMKDINEALTSEKEVVGKDKANNEVKVEQLLKDKSKLNKLHSRVEANLKKLNSTIPDLQTLKDAAMGERDNLVGELDTSTAEKLKAEQGKLEWEDSYDAQKEYIDYLAFIL